MQEQACLNDLEGFAEIRGAKEYPGESDQGEVHQSQEDLARQRLPARPRTEQMRGQPLENEIETVERTPDHKGPARSVPQLAKQHRRDVFRGYRRRRIWKTIERGRDFVSQPIHNRQHEFCGGISPTQFFAVERWASVALTRTNSREYEIK